MVRPERIRQLNNHTYQSGPVVYWMNRDCRANDNWALLYAQELALEYKVPLLVLYNLEIGFLGGGYRQHYFKVKGLEEVSENLQTKSIPFFLVQGGADKLLAFFEHNKAGVVVTDFSPLRLQRSWVKKIRTKLSVPVYGVDAHNVIPIWVTSDKQEYAARTIRPKIHRLVDEYLEDFPKLRKHPYGYTGKADQINWQAVADDFPDKASVPVVDWITPGAKAAKRSMKVFLEERLDAYAEGRNVATTRGQSDLSPYLHYGQIAPARVALEAVKVVGKKPSHILHKERNGSSTGNNASAFLEELIVRRELADNYCFYNENYDSPDGFPDWAQKTLQKAAKDKREYVYTKKQFELAKTHDPLWNAAQLEMVQIGKMHGYMRMYWAKKILEWTKSPADAMKIAIYLNDKYELDGRDPNGYTGIAWSIGGVHDRPWFGRSIFGTVRYMAESGVKKRFDIKKYIARFS